MGDFPTNKSDISSPSREAPFSSLPTDPQPLEEGYLEAVISDTNNQERQAERKFKKGISMGNIVNKEYKAINWAIPDLLPEGLGILSGPPKIGKSFFVLNLALYVAIGNGELFNRFKMVNSGKVLMLSLEDSEKRIQDRLQKLGVNS